MFFAKSGLPLEAEMILAYTRRPSGVHLWNKLLPFQQRTSRGSSSGYGGTALTIRAASIRRCTISCRRKGPNGETICAQRILGYLIEPDARTRGCRLGLCTRSLRDVRSLRSASRRARSVRAHRDAPHLWLGYASLVGVPSARARAPCAT